MLHFSEALREELKQTGIKVSVLCPGPVRSPLRRIPRLDNSRRCLSPEEVALYTVRALAKNRALIIPGRRNRWLAATRSARSGNPTITLPAGFTAKQTPVAIQLVSAHLNEATLVRAGSAFQRVTDWHSRVPARW